MPSFFSRRTRSSNSRARSRCPDRMRASLKVVRNAASLSDAANGSSKATARTALPACRFACAYRSPTLRSSGASLYARPRRLRAAAGVPLTDASCPARRNARAASAVLPIRSAASARRSCREKFSGSSWATRSQQNSASSSRLRGFRVLLDGFVGMILFLLQEGVSSDALGQLLVVTRPQKPVVDGERFGFVLGLDEQIEQQAVVNRRAVRLIHPCVEIAERLRGFLMLRHLVEHRQIRLDRILDAVLLEEALGAIQMLAYVCGHPFRLPLR